ncbi:hypothetical protein J8I26_19960 [Herbaspirillum sp. LeCh32-8]|uniref:hypothetical protein n=1 Tax=Herbaspirillum sp. LeCh32-8 TaxID=2821356 RepID=UPI001AE7628F|nr:hypothetical protein [Herbaspirillum sp. LeCh32-8]MBP0600396.1 hypothetical protein [Herbaspirillum sp. LeCh32-8]
MTLESVIAEVLFESRSITARCKKSRFYSIPFSLSATERIAPVLFQHRSDLFSRNCKHRSFCRPSCRNGQSAGTTLRDGISDYVKMISPPHALSMCSEAPRLTSQCAIFEQRAMVKTLMAIGGNRRDNGVFLLYFSRAVWCFLQPGAGGRRFCRCRRPYAPHAAAR